MAQDELRRQHAEQIARAEYEVRLAQRQYLAVDPDNRLVVAELERRWETALQALAAARARAEQVLSQMERPTAMDAELRVQLRNLGPQLPQLWASDCLGAGHKKALLRSLIRRIILSRPVADRVVIKIVWVSGAYSQLTIHPAIQRTADLDGYDRLIVRIRELSAEGYDDREIARTLMREGFRSAQTQHLSGDVVGRLRRVHGIVSVRTQFRQQNQIAGQWTVARLTRQLRVNRRWLYELIARGVVSATQHPRTGQYLMPDDP